MRAIYASILLGVLWLAPGAHAQAPVPDAMSRERAITRSQHQAGFAYRELQRTQEETTIAEQDYRNAQAAYGEAQKRADETKRQLDAAKKTFDAAKAKAAQARKAYDEALTAVDRAFQEPPAK